MRSSARRPEAWAASASPVLRSRRSRHPHRGRRRHRAGHPPAYGCVAVLVLTAGESSRSGSGITSRPEQSDHCPDRPGHRRVPLLSTGGISLDVSVESVGDWQPVLRIGHFGLHLGVTQTNWVVGRPGEPAKNADQGITWLLPALEKPYADVHDTLAQGALTSEGAPLWDEVVRCALLEGGEHWANCGLSWLEEGYPVADVVDSLRRLKDAPGRSQPLRHRALRLWKASRSHPA